MTNEIIDNKKEKFIDACEELYNKYNFKDITIKSISEQSNFSRTSIYYYFQTKEEIFLALFKREYDRWIDEYLNFRVIFAYGLFFLSSLLTVYAYKFVPLSLGPVLEASGYVFVSVMGYFILKEKIGKRKFLGLVVIIAGIVIFNL